MGFFQTQQFQPQTLICDQFQIQNAFFIARLARERAKRQGSSIFANFIPCFNIGPNSSKRRHKTGILK